MQFDGSLVWVWLDKALATVDWILKFPSIYLHHLQGLSSDHKPLWLASDDVNARFYRSQKPFRFEAMWLKDDHCEDVVHSAWDMWLEDDDVGKVLRKVFDCQTKWKLWDKNTFGNICIALASKRKELLKVEGDFMAGKGHARVKTLTDEIHKFMDKEECMWHQRSRIDWLKFGD